MKKELINAVHAWLMFTLNYRLTEYSYDDYEGNKQHMYVPEFLVKVKWQCLTQHMVEKWKNACAGGDCYANLTRFYAELDNQSSVALLSWVIDNYQEKNQICK